MLPDNIIEEDTILTLISTKFGSGYLWQFMYKGFKISMKVKDGPLMKLIDGGERFGKGDSLEVKLEILQKYNPSYQAYENVRFKIKEFIRHLPTPKDGLLFNS